MLQQRVAPGMQVERDVAHGVMHKQGLVLFWRDSVAVGIENPAPRHTRGPPPWPVVLVRVDPGARATKPRHSGHHQTESADQSLYHGPP